MSIRHTLTKGVALSTLLLLIAGPAGAATSDTTTRGTAATTSVPLHVEAAHLPIDLGRTVLMATTDSDTTTLAPWSTVQLTLANLGGAKFGEVDVSSDGTTSSTGTSVNRDTAIGAVDATTSSVLARADEVAGSAAAALTTLTTNATVLNALDLEATISGVTTTVNDDAAAAAHSLAVAGIDLELAHVLGTVLDQLPLEDLLELADILEVDVPVNLAPVGAVVTATEELVLAVTEAVDAADAVDTAVTDLLDADALDPLADFGDIAAYETLLDDLQALDPVTVANLLTVAGDLTAIITGDTNYQALGCGESAFDTGALDAVLQVQTTLDEMTACVQAHLSAYAAAVAELDDELLALQGAVARYVEAVGDAATAAATAEGAGDGMPVQSILDDIADLIAALLDADLLGVGPIEISQEVRAVGGQLDDSFANNTCEVTTLAALGATPVEVADCDGGSDTLTTVVDTVSGALQMVLDTVEGIDAGDGVSLELFGTNTTSVTDAGDGWVRATSVMEVLALTIPDVTVAPCDIADGLVCGLGLDIDDTLATVLGTLAGALTTAQATAEAAIDTVAVSDLLTALGAADLIADVTGIDAAASQTAVDDAVDAVLAALNTLIDGLGDLGSAGGVTVPGARIVVDPSLEAEHQVVAAGDGTTPAADPGDDPTLPNTGGGAALLAMLAIGAGAWLWRRREAH